MEKNKFYVLPDLPYGYKDLAPHISEEQLRIHHDKHHMAYVNGANGILTKIDKVRKEGTDLDLKAELKALSFNIGGHRMHSLFWSNMAPPSKGGGGKPGGALATALDKEFGNLDRFKKEFSQASNSVEGSGWGALTLCMETGRPIIMQVEKHNSNVYPGYNILMVLDVFEHAYYIDYKNDRAKFVEAFWNITNWDAIAKRYEKSMK